MKDDNANNERDRRSPPERDDLIGKDRFEIVPGLFWTVAERDDLIEKGYVEIVPGAFVKDADIGGWEEYIKPDRRNLDRATMDVSFASFAAGSPLRTATSGLVFDWGTPAPCGQSPSP